VWECRLLPKKIEARAAVAIFFKNETRVCDADGVALAAIQGLNQKVDEKETRLQAQAEEISELKARLQRLEQLLETKNAKRKK